MGEKALRWAVTVALIELVCQEAVLIDRGALGGAPLRPLFLLAKLPIALLALRRSVAAYFLVWAYELAGFAAVLDLPLSGYLRVGFGVMSLAVMVLLGRATSAFPPVEWKSR